MNFNVTDTNGKLHLVNVNQYVSLELTAQDKVILHLSDGTTITCVESYTDVRRKIIIAKRLVK